MGTIEKETKALLFSIYNSVDKQFLPQKGEGWVNLAQFGSAIKKVGVKYVDYGYSKLGQLIAAIDNVEVFSDESVRPPVKYLRFKSVKKDNDSVTSKHKDTIKTTDTAIVEFRNNSQTRKKDSRYIDLCRQKPMGWGTKQLSCLIGFYDDEHKSFSKIWTRNFRKIDNYPNSVLPVCPLPVSSNGLIHNQVYTFNWDFSNSSTNIYDIVVAKNSQFRRINARQLIETLYKDSIDNESREKDISVSAVETIKNRCQVKTLAHSFMNYYKMRMTNLTEILSKLKSV